MSENSSYANCINGSLTRSPAREQCSPIQAIGTPAIQIEEQLNEVYEKRLKEINEQANGDATLKEITYKEWIGMLRQTNKTLITNMQEMEREITERLALLERKASSNCRYGSDSELCKCRKDVAGLIQLVRNGRRSGDWSVQKFNFETITEQDIFGNEGSYEPAIKYETECNKQSIAGDARSCVNQKTKLVANVKALAFEVADKHDEIRDLKKQILSMEDEIQKAQKKIQLKDNVIRELRNDLKALPKCPAFWGPQITQNPCCSPMADVKSAESSAVEFVCAPGVGGCYSNRDSINSMSSNPLESIFGINIPDDELEEEEFIKCLKEELNQLFEMRRDHDENVEHQRRAITDQQTRLNDMVDKLLKNNNDLQNKLRYYRRELLNLENPQSSRTLTFCSDGDSGISSDLDPDVKIVNSVRGRIACLVDENYRLKKEEQSLQIKYEDVNCKAIAKAEILEQTSKALREVADALSNATCKPIAYDKIFGQCQNMTANPIVEAVDDLMDKLRERERTITDLKQQIVTTAKLNQELEVNSQRLRAEICELNQSNSGTSQNEIRGKLFQNQEFSRRILEQVEQVLMSANQAEKYQEENSGIQQENQSEYLRIIDDLSTELNSLSRQVNMVQREFLTDEIAKQFESTLKGLETQNDLLQAAIESLIEERNSIEQTLQTQNEELKRRLCNRDEEVCGLQNQVAQLQHRPCPRCAGRVQLERERDDRRDTPRSDSADELQKLEFELRRKSKTVECLKNENVKLNDELIQIRRNQAKTKLLQRRNGGERGAGPAATCGGGGGGSNNQDLMAKLHTAQEKNQEQYKSLQKAAREISILQDEVDELRAKEETFSKERELLQTELIASKEKQACQLGTQQSLQEQLQGTISELYVAKEKLQECMQVKDRLDNVHRDEVKRFQDLKADMFEKYNNLVEDYNSVLKEYQKVVQIEQEKTNQIRAFNAWKEEQIQIEREVRKKMQMFENHIKELLEDKQNLLDRLNETENDNRTLMQSLDQSASRSLGNHTRGATSPARGYTVVTATSSTDPVSKVIENVRNTSRRLSHQRSVLEDEASRYFSK